MNLKRLFTQHPHAVGESYLEHMKVALAFAGPLAGAALAALVHAFLPFLFATAASGTVKRLHVRMVNRVPKAPLHEAPAGPANGMPAWDPVI
jgi:hypothetical protein